MKKFFAWAILAVIAVGVLSLVTGAQHPGGYWYVYVVYSAVLIVVSVTLASLLVWCAKAVSS